MNKIIVVAGLSVLCLTSCGAKKVKQTTKITTEHTATVPVTAAPKISIADYKAQIQKNEYQYQTLSLETTADLDFPGLNKSVDLNLRLEKGQKIWASVTFFGIEAARVLITPEKIQILNKFQSQYIEKPFSFLYTYMGEIDFQTFQDILVGNVPNELWGKNPEIQTSEAGASILKLITGKLIFQYVFNTNVRPESIFVNHLSDAQKLQVKYSNFSQTELFLPTHLVINAQTDKSEVSLTIDYKSVKRNIQLDFPFKVPSRYTTIN